MRLHRLQVAAFGPFAALVDLDLDAANDAGLFLLRGDTGSGKTTLLDAISFALFGDVPGVRPAGTNLRSDHAEADLATAVTLEVTLAGERLLIERSPAQERPSKRAGGGTVDDPATVSLSRWDGTTWHGLASKTREVNAFLNDRLGMSAEQFHQVVLLPQGDFAAFLQATAETRRTLLERLFGTQRFLAVERWLAEEASRRDAAVGDAQQGLYKLVAVTAAHATVPDPGPAGLPLADVPTWAADLAAHATAEATAARHQSNDFRAALDAARASHTAAEVLHQRQTKHAATLAGAERLAAAADAIDAQRHELAAAGQAATVAPLAVALGTARADLVDAEARLAGVEAAATTAGLTLADDTALATARDDAVRVLAELETIEAASDAAPALARKLTEHVGALAAIADERTDIAQRTERRPTMLAASSDALSAARTAQGQLAGAQASVTAAQAVLDAARRRDRIEADLVRVRADAHRAADAHLAASGAAIDARERRLRGMAAELAGNLHAGADCPVCGSAEHPARALPTDDAVTAHDQATLDAAAGRAETDRTTTEAAVAALVVERAAAVAACGATTAAEATEKLRATTELLTATSAVATDADAHEAEVDALNAAEQTDNRRLTELAAAHAHRSTEGDALERQLADIATQVAGALHGFDDLGQRRRHVDAQRSAAEALLEARHRHVSAGAVHTSAAQQAHDQATVAGFASVDHAIAAVRPPSRVTALAADVRSHDAATAANAAVLADPELAAAAATPRPDLPALAEALGAADAASAKAGSDADSAEQRATDLATDVVTLSAHLHDLAPLRDAADLADGMARLTNGKPPDNPLRLRLSAYVLSAKLEQVAEVASDRLRRMSGGRYTLETSDDNGARGQGGLGLRVADAWSMTSRPTSTLSGGESFFASLALALALADVVTDEAAGSPLETLFIDEGFGSLDDETLDDVMGVLDSLREGGRTIGVVSHVADLRQRITAQLVVAKTTSGSTVAWQRND